MTIDQLARTVEELKAELRLVRQALVRVASVPAGVQGTLRFAQLTENLTAGSTSTPSEADADLYESDTNDPPQLTADANQDITVVNYNPGLTATSGDFVIVAQLQGVWHVIAVE